ncbi:Magnesium transport protein CorA [compost metagenome]
MIAHLLVMDPKTGRVRPVAREAFHPEDVAGQIVWVDLQDPSREELAWIGGLYSLHPLALEDALKGGQRPKLEHYGTHAFMVLYDARFERRDYRVLLKEVDVFLAPGFVLTSHRLPVSSLEQAKERWIESPEAPKEGAGYLFYLIADTLVDDYFPVLDEFQEALEELEDELFFQYQPEILSKLFALKKQLLFFRRVVGPTRDAFVMLVRREVPLIGQNTLFHLQDVYDHLIRVTDAIDLYRDLVGSAVDAYMSLAANRTNDTMKRLTTISAVLMSVTLVAGIYGMNFRVMPELQWQWGYAYALGLMLAIALVLVAWFKRLRYF